MPKTGMLGLTLCALPVLLAMVLFTPKVEHLEFFIWHVRVWVATLRMVEKHNSLRC